MKRFLLIIIYIVTSLYSFSQTLNVKSISCDSSDTSAIVDKQIDVNGKECALLKVRLPYPNAEFDGLISGNVKYRDEEYFVYLSPGAKRIRISLRNFLPLDVVFSDYGINKLDGLQTYVLTVESPTPKLPKLGVKSFKYEQEDMSARTSRRDDGKGEGCALLKIQFAKPNAEFDGNIVGDIKYEKSEYWVYLLPGTKHIRMSHSEYLPLDVIFANYGFDELKGLCTYILTVELPFTDWSRHDSQPIETQKVIFELIPNAKLIIDNEEWETNITHLSIGSHSYKVTAPYYKDVVGTINVTRNMEKDSIKIKMERKQGLLNITSTPSAADIFINNKMLGQTPYEFRGDVGVDYIVQLYKPGYQKEVIRYRFNDEKGSTIHKDLSESISITVRSNPIGADSYINGVKQSQKTPLVFTSTAGTYKISLQYKGYHRCTKKLKIDGNTTEYVFNLRRRYHKKCGGYLEGGLQFGNLLGVGAELGCYIYGINAEVEYIKGLSKSEMIFWNSLNTTDSRIPTSYYYEPTYIGGCLGYGFIPFNRLRLTPQIGFGVVSLKGALQNKGETEGVEQTYVADATFATRFHFAVTPCLGVSLTPEYSMAIKKGDAYSSISSASPIVKKWGEGFNCKIGVNVFF